MLGYVLITYGPKPSGPLREHAAARQQIVHLKQMQAALGAVNLRIVGEYTRLIGGLTSLPTLRKLLVNAKSEDGGVLVIDDLRRLFRRCRADQRAALLSELMAFADRLYVIRSRSKLSDFPTMMLTELVQFPDGAPFILKGTRSLQKSRAAAREQTENARFASSLAARKVADNNARKLAVIRDELLANAPHVTNGLIADHANRRGVTPPRGGAWRRDTVARALKRLTDSTSPA